MSSFWFAIWIWFLPYGYRLPYESGLPMICQWACGLSEYGLWFDPVMKAGFKICGLWPLDLWPVIFLGTLCVCTHTEPLRFVGGPPLASVTHPIVRHQDQFTHKLPAQASVHSDIHLGLRSHSYSLLTHSATLYIRWMTYLPMIDYCTWPSMTFVNEISKQRNRWRAAQPGQRRRTKRTSPVSW